MLFADGKILGLTIAGGVHSEARHLVVTHRSIFHHHAKHGRTSTCNTCIIWNWDWVVIPPHRTTATCHGALIPCDRITPISSKAIAGWRLHCTAWFRCQELNSIDGEERHDVGEGDNQSEFAASNHDVAPKKRGVNDRNGTIS